MAARPSVFLCAALICAASAWLVSVCQSSDARAAVQESTVVVVGRLIVIPISACQTGPYFLETGRDQGYWLVSGAPSELETYVGQYVVVTGTPDFIECPLIRVSSIASATLTERLYLPVTYSLSANGSVIASHPLP